MLEMQQKLNRISLCSFQSCDVNGRTRRDTAIPRQIKAHLQFLSVLFFFFPFSSQSDNSYDYLSVEEKECLMFLEETIGSLDAGADSGVSTDETDYAEASRLPRARLKRDSTPQGKLGIGLQPCLQRISTLE